MKLVHFVQKITILFALLSLFGCATGEFRKTPLETKYRRGGVAIIGVSAAKDVDAGANKAILAREFAQLISETGRFSVLQAPVVAKALATPEKGEAHPYDLIMNGFASTGRLSSSDIRALLGAKLPVPVAVIVRIEKNRIIAGKPVDQEISDSAGQVLSDRKRVVLSKRRETVMKATMVNLNTGSIFWSRSYQATPKSESSYVLYSGSSFSGSLAAALANTMANGIKVPEGPMPPSNRLTMRSLMREVARNMPSP